MRQRKDGLQNEKFHKISGRCSNMRKNISRIEKIRRNANIQPNFDRLMEINSLKVYDMVNRF